MVSTGTVICYLTILDILNVFFICRLLFKLFKIIQFYHFDVDSECISHEISRKSTQVSDFSPENEMAATCTIQAHS
jgi:hypothetical protein